MVGDSPTLNMAAFNSLYCIEVGLRELIIDVMSQCVGENWHKSRLPADVLTKFREGRAYERSHRSIKSVSFHPIYYTDFPDLRKIIERSDNWKQCFEPLFGANLRQLLSSELAGIEVIRNKVAHNRVISSSELKIIEAASSRIESSVGADRWRNLIQKSLSYRPVFMHFDALANELQDTLSKISSIKEVTTSNVRETIRNAWWYDENYIGEPLTDIDAIFSLVDQYIALPRGWGQGPVLAKWVRENKISSIGAEAINLCRRIAVASSSEEYGQ